MSRVYLDACVIIYLIEAGGPFHQRAVERLQQFGGAPAAVLVTSLLSRIECRTRPVRNDDRPLLALYDRFFTGSRVHVTALTRETIDRATEVRARYGLKTPDALHIAAAIESRSDVFLTGDAALARVQEIPVDVLTA